MGPPAMALSWAAKGSSVGATSTPDGPLSRASTSGTRKASTRKLPLPRRCWPRCKATSYRPSAAVLGMSQRLSVDRAVAAPRCGQLSGRRTSVSLPTWVSTTSVGSVSTAGRAKPLASWSRTKCFMDTVSPTRSSVRSSTVWARRVVAMPECVLMLKRQASMPRLQRLKTKPTSALAPSPARALTIKPSYCGHLLSPSSSSKPRSMRAMPSAPVLPFHSGLPWQLFTATRAPATGRPLSRVVTQTRLDVRPRLKCTPRLVTSTPVRANMGALDSSSAWPRMRDSTSTTW